MRINKSINVNYGSPVKDNWLNSISVSQHYHAAYADFPWWLSDVLGTKWQTA